MPPVVTTSYPIEEETYEVWQSLAQQQHFTHTSPQTSTLQEHHNHLFHTPVYTHAIPNPAFPNQGSYPPYHTTPTYPYIHPTPPYTTPYMPQPLPNTQYYPTPLPSSFFHPQQPPVNTQYYPTRPQSSFFPPQHNSLLPPIPKHTNTRARGNMPHQGQISKG